MVAARLRYVAKRVVGVDKHEQCSIPTAGTEISIPPTANSSLLPHVPTPPSAYSLGVAEPACPLRDDR